MARVAGGLVLLAAGATLAFYAARGRRSEGRPRRLTPFAFYLS